MGFISRSHLQPGIRMLRLALRTTVREVVSVWDRLPGFAIGDTRWKQRAAVAGLALVSACSDGGGAVVTRDGPLIVWAQEQVGGDAANGAADITGRLSLDGECAFLKADSGDVWLPIWPKDTVWSAPGTVTVRGSVAIKSGDSVTGGGFFVNRASDSEISRSIEEAAGSCRGRFDEIAAFNPTTEISITE